MAHASKTTTRKTSTRTTRKGMTVPRLPLTARTVVVPANGNASRPLDQARMLATLQFMIDALS